MKVCFLTLYTPYTNLVDGVSIAIYSISKYLRDLGCDVSVVGLDSSINFFKKNERNNIIYYRIPSTRINYSLDFIKYICIIPKILQHIEREQKIDIFHAHGGYAIPLAIANLKKAKKILKLQQTGLKEDEYIIQETISQKQFLYALIRATILRKKIMHFIRKWYYSKMDKIISVTNYSAKLAQKKYSIQKEKIKVIWNGADFNELIQLSKKIDIQQIDNIVLYFGRISYIKGIDTLLQAIKVLLPSCPNIQLKLIGAGKSLPKYRYIAKNFGINKNVEFLGFLKGKELINRIMESKIVVMPSLSEGFPLTLAEAMILRKPIIASKLPVFEEILSSTDCGLLFDAGDYKELARNILYLLRDNRKRESIAQCAYEFAKDNLTLDKVAKETLKLYEVCITG
ncbi:MAG: glycosyltransferase family 4 protein [Candidatus Hodarchaeota archaeon]